MPVNVRGFSDRLNDSHPQTIASSSLRATRSLWLPRLFAVVCAALIAVCVSPGASFAAPAKHAHVKKHSHPKKHAHKQAHVKKEAHVKPKGDGTRVYLLRGLFNVFSTGMDGIRDKFKARGIEASVNNHLLWRSLADEAVADYKAGRARHIVIMGHSAGALNAVDMANRIGAAGVPVSLVVTFDPAFRNTVTSSNVQRVVNLYMPKGIGAKVYKGPGYKGSVENVDLDGKPVHHMTLDKIGFVQDMAIGYAMQALKGDRPAAPSEAMAARAKAGARAE